MQKNAQSVISVQLFVPDSLKRRPFGHGHHRLAGCFWLCNPVWGETVRRGRVCGDSAARLGCAAAGERSAVFGFFFFKTPLWGPV